jgi:hypothetical protein
MGLNWSIGYSYLRFSGILFRITRGCAEQLQGETRSVVARGVGESGLTMIKEYDLASSRQFFAKLDAFRIIFVFDDIIVGE